MWEFKFELENFRLQKLFDFHIFVNYLLEISNEQIVAHITILFKSNEVYHLLQTPYLVGSECNIKSWNIIVFYSVE